MSSEHRGDRVELLQGTLDLIVLQGLSTMGAQHAYGLAARLAQVADGRLTLNQGTLYPALVRLDDLRRDVIYAARTLARAPAFTTVAILTLALGIGANTAVFSITHAVLLRPLPYHQPDRLVAVWDRI